ncbi:hypothetical protein CLOM_g3578 [Closterium sp. NIES-68]|nr:hypothetical protein CLOM_g3578 [Closterium sp. NIES-68]GJP69860.1 hypothetical protein CLOP_g866 [Closterium sp. NIES-67]
MSGNAQPTSSPGELTVAFDDLTDDDFHEDHGLWGLRKTAMDDCELIGKAGICDRADALIIAEGDVGSRLHAVCAAFAVTHLTDVTTIAVWPSDGHMQHIRFADLFAVASNSTRQTSARRKRGHEDSLWVRSVLWPIDDWRDHLDPTREMVSIRACNESEGEGRTLSSAADSFELFFSPDTNTWLREDSVDPCEYEQAVQACLASLHPSPAVAVTVERENLSRIRAAHAVMAESHLDYRPSGCVQQAGAAAGTCAMSQPSTPHLITPTRPDSDKESEEKEKNEVGRKEEGAVEYGPPFALRATETRTASCRGMQELAGGRAEDWRKEHGGAEIDGAEGSGGATMEGMLRCARLELAELFALSFAHGLVASSLSSPKARFVAAQGVRRTQGFLLLPKPEALQGQKSRDSMGRDFDLKHQQEEIATGVGVSDDTRRHLQDNTWDSSGGSSSPSDWSSSSSDSSSDWSSPSSDSTSSSGWSNPSPPPSDWSTSRSSSPSDSSSSSSGSSDWTAPADTSSGWTAPADTSSGWTAPADSSSSSTSDNSSPSPDWSSSSSSSSTDAGASNSEWVSTNNWETPGSPPPPSDWSETSPPPPDSTGDSSSSGSWWPWGGSGESSGEGSPSPSPPPPSPPPPSPPPPSPPPPSDTYTDPGTPSTDPSSTNPDPNSAWTDPNTASTDAAPVDTSSGSAPTDSYTDPNTAWTDPNTASTDPNTAWTDPNTASTDAAPADSYSDSAAAVDPASGAGTDPSAAAADGASDIAAATDTAGASGADASGAASGGDTSGAVSGIDGSVSFVTDEGGDTSGSDSSDGDNSGGDNSGWVTSNEEGPLTSNPSFGATMGGEESMDSTACNIYEGEWVWDEANRPAYNMESCPFINTVSPTTSCLRKKYNRQDDSWMKYSWKPKQCGGNTIRFQAAEFAQKMQNKVIALVGDSLITEGFMPSLLCQLAQAGTVSRVEGSPLGSFVWRLESHNLTVANYWSPFLMWTSANPVVIRKLRVQDPGLGDTAVNLGAFDPQWFDQVQAMDLIVFQSATHWPHAERWLRRFFVDRKWKKIDPEPGTMTAYKQALNKLGKSFNAGNSKRWDLPVPYFLSAPPRLVNCQGSYSPANRTTYEHMVRNNPQSRKWFPTQRDVLSPSKNIRFVDITHPSLYRSDAMLASQSPESKDCLHPCLPGLPDIWVDLFYEVWKADPEFNS